MSAPPPSSNVDPPPSCEAHGGSDGRVAVTLDLPRATASCLAEAAVSERCSPAVLFERALFAWLDNNRRRQHSPTPRELTCSRDNSNKRKCSAISTPTGEGKECSVEGVSSWADLPGGVADQIFNLLEPRAAASARATCPAWAAQVFQNRRELSLDLRTSSMSMCTLDKLPSLKYLWVTVRSDWVVPHMEPIASFLLPNKAHHAATHLDLSQTFWKLDRQSLGRLAPLTSIQSLCLRNTGVEDDAVGALAPLTSLSYLDIQGCAVGLRGWDALMSLPRLAILDWSSNCLPSGRCPNSRQLVPSGLTSLNLANTSLGDRSLSFLSKLTALQSLDLSITTDCPLKSKHGAWLSDDALRSVTSLKSLATLRLQNQYGITPDGVSQLQTLGSLTELDLSGCLSMFEGNDLQGVAALTGLRRLSLQAVNSASGASPANLLAPLQALTNLTELDLSQNWAALSLDGLAPLAALTKLRSVDLAPPCGQQCWLASTRAGTYSLDELMSLVTRGVGVMKGIIAAERAREQAFGFSRPAALERVGVL